MYIHYARDKESPSYSEDFYTPEVLEFFESPDNLRLKVEPYEQNPQPLFTIGGIIQGVEKSYVPKYTSDSCDYVVSIEEW